MNEIIINFIIIILLLVIILLFIVIGDIFNRYLTTIQLQEEKKNEEEEKKKEEEENKKEEEEEEEEEEEKGGPIVGVGSIVALALTATLAVVSTALNVVSNVAAAATPGRIVLGVGIYTFRGLYNWATGIEDAPPTGMMAGAKKWVAGDPQSPPPEKKNATKGKPAKGAGKLAVVRDALIRAGEWVEDDLSKSGKQSPPPPSMSKRKGKPQLQLPGPVGGEAQNPWNTIISKFL